MWHGTDERPELTYDADESAAMDRWLIDDRGFTLEGLMEQAGVALAAAVSELCREHGWSRVVWMVGPGHNGGDALVARRVIQGSLVHTVWRVLTDPAIPDLTGQALVVDGLFGVGLCRPLEGAAAAAVDGVTSSGLPVLAVDVPSGLDGTTGEVLGSALVAKWTLTFVGPKTGFFCGSGPDHVGQWRAAEIGFPAEEAASWVRARRADST